MFVQMSEACEWKVMPWQWQKAPEWWIERLSIYWGARAEVDPILAAKHAEHAERARNLAGG